ncbi:Na+/H+ antiporter [Methanocaldococcus villosus KIN24-T80]|uniref:Na+/H+ antiporter n=1 Tax=Methanocaldococcus villosus KIN24-T80 TaxID=1069083 RepID=N6VSJ0_9EURY|nr:sodium:proton antiporter [Methanocaldococcus villosus]ENN96131.1 Na+/H+ antiporter [Methanocaldococcus villosus KIN24-T80]
MELMSAIGFLGLSLVLGSIMAKISEKLNIPDIPLLLMLGLILGPILQIIPQGGALEIFEYVGPIGLVFILLGGAFTMRISLLKKVIKTVIRLDTITLMVTLIISGIFFNFILNLPITSPVGYLFGAITCATDPATLIPVFSKVKVDPEIAITLEAESIFNDPLGIVATSTILGMLGLAYVKNPILYFLSLSLGAIIAGVIFAKIYKYIIYRCEFHEYVSPLVLGGAMLLLYLGEHLIPKYINYGYSGYMAIAVMALYLGNELYKLMGDKHKNYEYIVNFSNDLSLLARIFIFVFLGACINMEMLIKYLIPGTIVALVSIFIARPLGVFIGLLGSNISFKKCLYFALEGPRGVVPAALAATVGVMILKHADKLPKYVITHISPKDFSGMIIIGTFLTILLSVILEASWAGILARKLIGEYKGKKYDH